MNAEILVRPAIKSDMSSVLDLIRELAIYENAEEQVTNTIEQLQLDGFGNQPTFKCVVATENDRIIGFAIYYPSYSTWKGNCLYLEDLLVTESHRRKGVGKLLFDEVLQEAKNSGAKRFEWQVLDWNEPAINFYKKYKADLDGEWINGKIFL
jgi:GNAT superfamily N-acetyltransferase